MDEEFICLNCGYEVSKLNYTARDHCPNCLYSRHVDIMAGDRMNECCGLMKPIGIEKYKNTYKIIYKCLKYRGLANFYYIFDEHNLLQQKDSPIDRGVEVYEKLMKKRIKIN